ncbi:uncharacterized protein Eint_050420 [Encephalitozoon intestinalis ATCC 50506]|uniref:Uncharacterized protein n=1 Tax=Encephalitozoon intestinalis (strain ATCC 50506) TaxID=876142 RepID=E0S763_ENCIT|nr:uncharacterized protein Eint_050420 [Encephalitozoon intestinalis ATCC 50506]ADM11491.1 hypothetical protein Eint_050420 [Encephalitozoon intestinalis ATCC 50506]UTX45203.1 hypothetical protein GPK93_05g07470 [Encephalitozoon intestinalis]
MEFCRINELNKRIQELYHAMLAVVPLEGIGEHPFDYFKGEVGRIIDSVDVVLKEMVNKKLELQKEIDGMVKEMMRDCTDIEVSVPSIPNLCNLYVLKEYVRNEAEGIMILKKAVEGRMAAIIEEMELEASNVGMKKIDWMDMECAGDKKGVSLMNLRELEMHRDVLRNKRESMERNRDRLYRELCVFLSQLSRSDPEVTIDQKIFILERLHRRYKEEVEKRDKEFRGLEMEIRRREGYLGIACKDIEMDLSEANLEMMRDYERYLLEEQERQLDEIYEKKKGLLKELLEVFGEDMEDYKRTEKDIEEMSKMIEKLESKKDLFLSISSLMEKRSELISKMNEFEKIASDPKRLFRSSLQLLSEEKFRNSAYPNLIRIEETMFKLLDEYENRFGKLFKDGVDFKGSLREEIENRIVNKTVFINRLDSPSRKRR